MKTTPQSLPPFLVSVSSRFGAPMGRRDSIPADASTVRALSLSFVPFVDGDYDQGGAYWGGGASTLPLFCAWGETEDGEAVHVFTRAASYASAATFARVAFPNATVTNAGLSDFARAYVEAALWLFGEGDEPGKDELDPATLETMAREADAFAASNRALIGLADLDDTRAGHCFYLSRNGHGSGFFDEPESRAPLAVVNACDRLQEAARKAGERDLYRGDDGKIYQE